MTSKKVKSYLPPLLQQSTSSPGTTLLVTPSTTISSVGAVGTMYTGFEDAGNVMSQRHWNSYPVNDGTHIVPPLFVKKFTDVKNIQPNPQGLTVGEQNRFLGILNNMSGEEAEKVVFDIFTSLSRTNESQEHYVLLHSLTLDIGKPVIKNALFAEFPSLDPTVRARGEHDIVIMIKSCGFIIAEIKRTASTENIQKAESQLDAGVHLTKSLMTVLSNGTVHDIPVLRMILCVEEVTPSPTSVSTFGTFILHNDRCIDFLPTWKTILTELHQLKVQNPFTDADFQRLAHVFFGIWSAHPIKKGRSITYDDTKAYLRSELEEVDEMVKKGELTATEHMNLTSSVKDKPVTDVSRCQPTEVFRTSSGTSLLYLTPEQRRLFDYMPVAIISGNAGSGKTVVMLFKVIQLYEADNSVNILIVAPLPHNIRMKRQLLENNVLAELINEFPPPSRTPNTVLIITLEDFFAITPQDLMSYPLQDFNLLIDDIHTYQRISDDVVSYEDIGRFVEQTGLEAQRNKNITWCGIDVVQGGLHDSDEYSVHLFQQTFTIPVVKLTKVLRNTREIIQIADEIRSSEIFAKSQLQLKGILQTFDPAHDITSFKVVYHELQKLRRGAKINGKKANDKEYKTLFLCTRIQAEVRRITGPGYTGGFSHIAVLFDSEAQLDSYKQPIVQMLTNEFNAVIQTIFDLETNDNGGLVMDDVSNVMSFESMCVIYVKTSNGYDYNMVTRARVVLNILDLVTDAPPLSLKNMDLLKWKHDGAEFKMYK